MTAASIALMRCAAPNGPAREPQLRAPAYGFSAFLARRAQPDANQLSQGSARANEVERALSFAETGALGRRFDAASATVTPEHLAIPAPPAIVCAANYDSASPLPCEAISASERLSARGAHLASENALPSAASLPSGRARARTCQAYARPPVPPNLNKDASERPLSAQRRGPVRYERAARHSDPVTVTLQEMSGESRVYARAGRLAVTERERLRAAVAAMLSEYGWSATIDIETVGDGHG